MPGSELESRSVLVTGADGFVGRAVCAALRDTGFSVRRGLRVPDGESDAAIYGDLAHPRDFAPLVTGCSTVIHLAGKVHAVGKEAADEGSFQAVNVDATLRLARCAAAAGVARFIFASTLAVHAPKSDGPLRSDDAIAPETPYAWSKWRAEMALRSLEKESGLAVVVIRPPLVYGPNCPGNMARLARLIATGLPLPFGLVSNARSFIDVDNLAGAFLAAMREPAAAGRTFLVCDGQDVSLPQMLRFLAQGMRRPARLFPVPGVLLATAGRLAGKSGEMSKLIDSLRIDNDMAAAVLGFVPKVDVADGLRRTGQSFRPAKPG